MVRLCFTILSLPLSSSNLYFVYLLSGISYGIANSFSIYSSVLQYKNFLVISFINRLDRNVSTLYLIAFDSAK